MLLSGAITETLLLFPFVTYKSPFSGLKAMPNGCEPTAILSMTNPCGASVSVTCDVTGNCGLFVLGAPLSEPLKERSVACGCRDVEQVCSRTVGNGRRKVAVMEDGNGGNATAEVAPYALAAVSIRNQSQPPFSPGSPLFHIAVPF